MSSPAASESTPPGAPNPQLRTLVSLLLFVHLFAVGTAVLTNSDSGAPQLLRDARMRTPGLDPYLTQLWLNRPYDYHLMNDQPLDYDHRLDATIHYADGRPDEAITLPPAGVWPSERRQRYQQLAWYIDRFKTLAADTSGASEEDESRKMLLPGAIGAGLLRQHPGATSVALKCSYHRGIRRDQLLSGDKKEGDPEDAQYFELVSNVTVLLVVNVEDAQARSTAALGDLTAFAQSAAGDAASQVAAAITDTKVLIDTLRSDASSIAQAGSQQNEAARHEVSKLKDELFTLVNNAVGTGRQQIDDAESQLKAVDVLLRGEPQIFETLPPLEVAPLKKRAPSGSSSSQSEGK